MALGEIADRLIEEVEARGAALNEALFEPVIRLGVTGLSGAGKTVFITSLVANLLDRARMHELSAAREGRIRAVYLQPQPDDTVARFDYEAHLARLLADPPGWPESTRTISELRLSFRLRPGGLAGAIGGERRVHLDIVDYPGEWLLDLALLDQSYRQWSEATLARMRADPAAAAALADITATDPAGRHDEARATALARAFTAWLTARRTAGMALTGPGRFVLPGEMAGSPALSFAPLPAPDHAPRGSLWREMARRYEAYRAHVVRPFFRQHFARIDRQVVLVDALGALHAGPGALAGMREAMAGILTAFRPGRASWLARALGAHRVQRILFAATKADHLHHSQHPRLVALMEAALAEARARADYAGAGTRAMAIAAARATTEVTLSREGRRHDCVRGVLMAEGREAAFWPGDLPERPEALLRAGAQPGPPPGGDFARMRFAPARPVAGAAGGLAHIRLDRAAEFLIGDRLR